MDFGKDWESIDGEITDEEIVEMVESLPPIQEEMRLKLRDRAFSLTYQEMVRESKQSPERKHSGEM